MSKNIFDLVPEAKIKETELVNIKGGIQSMLADGGYSGICSIKINTSYCDGGAVCTCGIAGEATTRIER